VEVESYRRRRPEESVLYKVVQENLATFLEVAALRSGGKSLPTYVRQEFERYLDCGILANGFARVRCPACGHDEVVAFSCKGRGFCPSCMGRRMADTAAYLVDHVFPQVPIRQWVLSFPWQIRLHLARDSKLLTRAINVFIEEVSRHYERELIYARVDLDPDEWRHRRSLRSGKEVFGGAVTAVQRYGSSLNLNVHLHTLALDGVYWREPETNRVRFFEAPAPTAEALEEVVHRVARRVRNLLIRKGLLVAGEREEGGTISIDPEDPTALDLMQGASIREIVGLGNKWKRVEVKGRQKDMPWVQGGKPFTAEEDGYTIHAGVWLDGRVGRDGPGREKLEKVCRYLLRPAFAEDRLSLRPDGKIEYELRKRRWDGGTSVVLEPLELMEKLAALVPAPRSHLVRYHGVLAPSHEWRVAVVPPPPPEEEPEDCARRPELERWDPDEEDRPWRERRRKKRKPTDWATLIRRSLKLDVLSCPKCGGRMKVISTITEPGLVRRILRSMGLSTEIPSRAPPRGSPPGDFDFVQ
jgi:hypothetical protein